MPNNKHLDTAALTGIVVEILKQKPNYFMGIVEALHKRTGNWYESKTRYILEALVDTGEISFVNRNDFSPNDKVWRKVFSIRNANYRPKHSSKEHSSSLEPLHEGNPSPHQP